MVLVTNQQDVLSHGDPSIFPTGRGSGNRRLAFLAVVFLSTCQVTCGMHQDSSATRQQRHEGLDLVIPGGNLQTLVTEQASIRIGQVRRVPVAQRFARWIRKSLPKWEGRGSLADNSSSSTAVASLLSSHEASQSGGEDDLYDEAEDDEEDTWRQEMEEQPIGSLIAGAIGSLLSDPNRLRLVGLKAIWFYVCFYVAKTTWKAINELSQDLSSSGDNVLFCPHSTLPRLLDWLENPTSTVLPASTIELARDLHFAGLPIRSPPVNGRASIESLFKELTTSEASILQQCLWRPPPSVRSSPGALWENLLGLDAIKERLLLTIAATSFLNKGDDNNVQKNIVQRTQEAYAPLLTGDSASPTSTSQHHGILLYGEPGCGKSFLVQALAAKLRTPCLVVTPSVLMRKYVGDTNLNVRALFALTRKLSPCILVLDELDGLFRERHDQEHDSSRELKTEFLQWLSGIMTTSGSTSGSDEDGGRQQPLIVVGATNRPFDVDSAILRRLPQRYYIGPPTCAARCQLIERMLQGIPISADFRIDALGLRTDGFTPGDIQLVLQLAARTGPIKESILQNQREAKQVGLVDPNLMDLPRDGPVRSLTMQDALNALAHVHATPLSPRYLYSLRSFARKNGIHDAQLSSQQTPAQYPPGNPWGMHVLNMGTVHLPSPGEPLDNFSVEESLTSSNFPQGEDHQWDAGESDEQLHESDLDASEPDWDLDDDDDDFDL
jgi:ATPase family AAA domain-containing protein 1